MPVAMGDDLRVWIGEANVLPLEHFANAAPPDGACPPLLRHNAEFCRTVYGVQFPMLSREASVRHAARQSPVR
jgi:hypothetical protein